MKSGLTKEQVAKFSILGLFDGWMLPGLLEILTNGGLVDDGFLAIFGQHITGEDWDSLLEAGASAGLLDVGRGRIFRVVPIVGLVLRNRLAAEFGENGLLALQCQMAVAIWGWLSHSGPIDFWSTIANNEWLSYQLQRSALSIFAEENIARALRFTIRNEHDSVASHIARGYLGGQLGDHFRLALTHIRQILSYERRPDARYDELSLVVARAEASQASAELRWPQCLENAERALELARSLGEDAGEIVELSCMLAHALARLHRIEETVRTLTDAAAQCASVEQRDAVLEEFSNIVEMLNMPDGDIAEAEQ
jgi:hypothetical protein